MAILWSLPVLLTAAAAEPFPLPAPQPIPAATVLSAPPPPGTGCRNISFDHRSLLFCGQRALWLAGSVHYWRHTPSQWQGILAAAKANGLGGITVYGAPFLHQPEPNGELVFDGRLNITHFLDIAQQNGLWVHLRVGPYSDGEMFYGGFPWWLRDIPGIAVRQTNAPYQKWMEAYLRAYMKVIEPYLAVNGGPVLMWQVENEFSGADTDYGNWALKLARKITPDTVITFCNNSGSRTYPDYPGVLYTANAIDGNPASWFETAKHWETYPNQPPVWTEVEGDFETWDAGGYGRRSPTGEKR